MKRCRRPQGDGVPPSDAAAAQRSEWIDEIDDEVQFEAMEAVSSGTYALRPVSLADGDMTAYEDAATLTVDSFGSTRSAASAELLETCGTVFLAQNTPSESKKTILQAHNFDLPLRLNDYVECVNCKCGRCIMMPSSPGLRNSFVGIVIEKCIMNVASITDGGATRLRHVRRRARAFSRRSRQRSRSNIAEKGRRGLRLTGGGRGAQRGKLKRSCPTLCGSCC